MKFRLSVVAVVSALIGSTMGSKLALQIPDTYFRIILLIVLPATALYLLFKKNALGAGTLVGDEINGHQLTLTVIIAVLLGVYDGFYGPGTGTFLLLCLTGLAKLPLNLAAGTTKVINLTTNITALVVFLTSGKVILVLGAVAGIFGIAGNFLGARYFKKGGSRVAKPIILVVLALFLIKLIYDFMH